MNIPEWIDFEKSLELNFILKWMNESYFEPILVILMKSPPFFVCFGHFLGTFYSTSINDSPTIELNYRLIWITRVYLELNDSLNWILGNQYRIESNIELDYFYAKFKHWIESDRVSSTSINLSEFLLSIYFDKSVFVLTT